MGDSDKNLEVKSDNFDEVTVEDVAVKTARPAKARKEKEGFFSQVKAEFRKAVWPSGKSLWKMTASVLISSVVLGAIIVAVDLVIRLGLELIV